MKRCQGIPRFFWEVCHVNGLVKLVEVDHKEDMVKRPQKVREAWEIAKDFPQNGAVKEKVYVRPCRTSLKREPVVHWRT